MSISTPISTCNFDGKCEFWLGETTANCADCGATCGTGVCTAGETTANCPYDCCPHAKTAKCGDKRCDAWRGENCSNCPQDCAAVINAGAAVCCGGQSVTAVPSQMQGQGCSGNCNRNGAICLTNCY